MINRLLNIKGNPKKIAYGFALGTFLGFMPFIGFQAAIAVVIASLLKWNKLSAGIAVFNTNIVTGPFIFGLSYLIGANVLGYRRLVSFPEKFEFSAFWNLLMQSHEVLLSLIAGGILLGFPVSILSYFLSLFAIRNYQLKMSGLQKPR